MIVGIDPSLTSTAIIYGNPPDFEARVFSSKPLGSTVAGRIKRYESLVHPIDKILKEINPTLIAIEGYALGSNSGKVIDRAEYGGLLRFHMVDYCPVIEVSPLTLKKFAVGTGKSSKNQIGAWVQRRWGVILSNDDETDAYVAFRLGACLAGICAPENKPQEECVKTALKQNDLSPESLRQLLSIDPDNPPY